MICSLCFSENEITTHLSIYLTGSEGVELCPICRLDLTDHLRRLRSMANRTKKETYLNAKKLRFDEEVIK